MGVENLTSLSHSCFRRLLRLRNTLPYYQVLPPPSSHLPKPTLIDRSGKLPFLIRIFDGDFCAFGTILSIIVVLRCCSNQDEKRIFHSRQFKCGVILNEGACRRHKSEFPTRSRRFNNNSPPNFNFHSRQLNYEHKYVCRRFTPSEQSFRQPQVAAQSKIEEH
jgi:hypothetical protein